ncbi:MAG: hypothetical protein DRI97_13020 [Bacteroidetes bacterium]|nr:MAG: hypothetical protein DRI97_13020 [Bacteroidota bacterium]RLD94770.1 MAG: hypothetical protein DRJ29_04860 [Bacteroidota bacterium]
MEVVSNIDKQVEEASRGFRLSIESTLQVGFNLFRKAPSEFIVFSVLGVIIFSNPLSGLLLGGPTMASYFHLAQLASRGQQIEISDFFRGFDKGGSLIKLSLLIFVIVLLGLMMLIIPGIYFAVSYVFSHSLVWFYDKDPTEAIRLSRKIVSGNFKQILLLFLILAGINLLGLMALGVGILLTMPFSFCVLYAAFDDIIGVSN